MELASIDTMCLVKERKEAEEYRERRQREETERERYMGGSQIEIEELRVLYMVSVVTFKFPLKVSFHMIQLQT